MTVDETIKMFLKLGLQPPSHVRPARVRRDELPELRRAALMPNGREMWDWSVGPVTLDLIMAKRVGWSEMSIARAKLALAAISRRESALAHRAGPVRNCPCVACDRNVHDDALVALAMLGEDVYLKRRAKWKKAGTWAQSGRKKLAKMKAAKR